MSVLYRLRTGGDRKAPRLTGDTEASRGELEGGGDVTHHNVREAVCTALHLIVCRRCDANNLNVVDCAAAKQREVV